MYNGFDSETLRKYREVLYSGESDFDTRLYINNVLIDQNQISSIKKSSPIIDTTAETGKIFHIGTFISEAIDITFRNIDGLNLESKPDIYLEIGLNVEGEYKYVPIGRFLVDDLSEDYYTKSEVTLLDYAVKFKNPVDISKFFDDTGKITAENLLFALGDYFGVEIGSYPNVNRNHVITQYDSSISGKLYISYIAELMGGNAKINREGKLDIIPLKKDDNDIVIDIGSCEKFEYNSTYELQRVCYESGPIKYEFGGNIITVSRLPVYDILENTIYFNTTNMKYYIYRNSEWVLYDLKNTLYIRPDNLFITDKNSVQNIYNSVQGFYMDNITIKTRGDMTLDSYDMVSFVNTDDNDGTVKYYYCFYDNKINFNGASSAEINVNIPIQAVEETTNIIDTIPDEVKIKRLRIDVDHNKGQIEFTREEVGKQDTKIGNLSLRVDELESEIKETAGVTETKEGFGRLEFKDINQSEPIYIRIYPRFDDITGLHPRPNLYPGPNLKPHGRILRFYNSTLQKILDYNIPSDLLYYNDEIYDEFILNYSDLTCTVYKRVEINRSTGEKYPLQNTRTITYDYPIIELEDGDYALRVMNSANAYIRASLMIQNIYTEQFATKIEMSSKIKQTKDEINLGVNQKLTNYSTTSEMNSEISIKANEINSEVRKKVGENEIISKINQTPETITINANKISLKGKSINLTSDNIQIKSNNFSVNENGDLSCTNANITGTINATNGKIAGYTIDGNILKGSQVGMSGKSGEGVAFWAGSDNTGSAPFRVGHDGSLIATNATISGGINATTGTFQNCEITGSCTINGIRVDGEFIKNKNISDKAISGNKISGGIISGSSFSGLTVTAHIIGVDNDFGHFEIGDDTGQTVNITVPISLTVVDGKITGQTWRRLRFKGGILIGVDSSW